MTAKEWRLAGALIHQHRFRRQSETLRFGKRSLSHRAPARAIATSVHARPKKAETRAQQTVVTTSSAHGAALSRRTPISNSQAGTAGSFSTSLRQYFRLRSAQDDSVFGKGFWMTRRVIKLKSPPP